MRQAFICRADVSLFTLGRFSGRLYFDNHRQRDMDLDRRYTGRSFKTTL